MIIILFISLNKIFTLTQCGEMWEMLEYAFIYFSNKQPSTSIQQNSMNFQIFHSENLPNKRIAMRRIFN